MRKPGHRLARTIRHVDVQQRIRRQPAIEHLRDQPRRELGGRSEIELRATGERDRERGNAEQRSLHRRRYRARVGDVVAEIRALVDARDHQAWARRQDPGDREIHAVGRRAVDRELTGRDLLDPQRAMQRQRVPGRALLAIRRHHEDLPEGLESTRESLDALRANAVVVADQNDHPAAPPPPTVAAIRYAIADFVDNDFPPGRLGASRIGRGRGPAARGGAGDVEPAPTSFRRRRAVEAVTVGAAGFEPATTRTPSVCATRLRHAPSVRACERTTRTMGHLDAQQTRESSGF